MQNLNVEIVKYSNEYREQIILVWEKSVLATHDFLSQPDFISIKEIVQTIDFNAFDVYCLFDGNTVLGFIGVADKKVEMLFIDPKFIGNGLGVKLMKFAVDELQANKLDVNEQNSRAVDFYKGLGFETYERTDRDNQGRNYPVLKMKLNPGYYRNNLVEE